MLIVCAVVGIGLSVWLRPVRAAGPLYVAPGASDKSITVPGPNIVTNGDFELPPAGIPGTTYYAGQTFGGWTVESGSVDQMRAEYSWQSASGGQSLDLSGDAAGTIDQDLPTTPGRSYKLRFAMAGNISNDPACGPQPQLKQMQIEWGATFSDTISFDITGHSGDNMGWTYYEYPVVAAADATSLKFRSLTNSPCGPTLDDVSVMQLPIGLSKTVDKTSVLPGEALSYTINIANQEATDLNGVFVTDTLPVYITYINDSLTATTGSYGYNSGA